MIKCQVAIAPPSSDTQNLQAQTDLWLESQANHVLNYLYGCGASKMLNHSRSCKSPWSKCGMQDVN